MQLISAIFFCVWASTVTSITVQTNGNTPENKIGSTMKNTDEEIITMKPLNSKSRVGFNVTNLTVNERYRRLIPYMTFYYANDGLSTSAKDILYSNDVEVEKAEIIEAVNIERQPKKIYHPTPYQNIPRFQTNRLQQYKTQPYPVKGYKETPHYITYPSYTPHFEQSERLNHHKIIYKPHNIKSPSVPFALPNRKPYINLFHGEDGGATRYYLPEKISKPKYKLVPYEQTPPVKIIPHESINIQPPKKSIPVPVLVSKDSVYIKPRPVRPQYAYNDISIQAPIRKPSMTVSESYYEKMHPPQESMYHSQNVYEQGEEEFKPIIFTTDSPVEITSNAHSPSTSAPRPENENAHYYHYNTDERNVQIDAPVTNEVPLADMIQPYDVSRAPGTNPNDNGSSIRALLQALNALKAMPTYNNIDHFTIPKPLTSPLEPNKEDTRPVEENTSSEDEPYELNNEYLAPLNPPSQHLDYMNNGGGGVTTQHFPPPVNSDAEGGTPGRPGIDYPIFTAIPETKFNCKTQRYKGFFADTETRCQVWHYCDLNGGQASFLCPNGTIFSQAGLTCDWWFNVRCSSTSQLYVLNESLYKYILPHKPKFPEDYSGPLVDKYLSLKFKEMEEQFRKNKHKQSAKEDDSEEEATSTEAESDTSSQDEGSKEIENNIGAIDESSVIVESPGTSGNVQRLQD